MNPQDMIFSKKLTDKQPLQDLPQHRVGIQPQNKLNFRGIYINSFKNYGGDYGIICSGSNSNGSQNAILIIIVN